VFDGTNFVADDTLRMECLDARREIVDGCCSSGIDFTKHFDP
jgi:hypothetical protein